jgi:hypothetical protein
MLFLFIFSGKFRIKIRSITIINTILKAITIRRSSVLIISKIAVKKTKEVRK